MIHWLILVGMASTAVSAQDKPTVEKAETVEVPQAAPQAPVAMTVPAPPYRYRNPQPNLKVEPTNTRRVWVRGSDYPKPAADEKRSGDTKVRLSINEQGRVADCTVLSSSGHEDLDEVACERIIERANFYPATDAEMEPISSTFDHTVKWRLRDEEKPTSADGLIEPATKVSMPVRNVAEMFPQPPRNRDYGWNTAGLNDYPAGPLERRSEGRVKVSLDIGPDGSVTTCDVIDPHEDAELNAASCARAMDLSNISPARDVAGEPTAGRIVQSVSWGLPKTETVVYPREPFPGPRYRRPVRMPFFGNGKTGFTMEVKADGTIVSCETVQEGKLPKGMDFANKMCADVLERGVRLEPNEGGEATATGVVKTGRKIRFEMIIESEEIENADKPAMTKHESGEKPE